jgi:nitrate reductase assembly molybdenum cofactor insertion protein NarJ
MAAMHDFEQLATVMVRPDDGYLDRVEALRESLATRHGEAARQLGAFTARLAGLSVDELQELFDETFDARAAAAVSALGHYLAHAGGTVTVLDVLPMVERLLPALEADRNPFVYLFKAVCCLVLASPGSGTPASCPLERTSSS